MQRLSACVYACLFTIYCFYKKKHTFIPFGNAEVNTIAGDLPLCTKVSAVFEDFFILFSKTTQGRQRDALVQVRHDRRQMGYKTEASCFHTAIAFDYPQISVISRFDDKTPVCKQNLWRPRRDNHGNRGPFHPLCPDISVIRTTMKLISSSRKTLLFSVLLAALNYRTKRCRFDASPVLGLNKVSCFFRGSKDGEALHCYFLT